MAQQGGALLQLCHILPGDMAVKSFLAEAGRGMFATRLTIVIAILGYAHSAAAHGIAGNRFFPGTLTFDDPAVADEAIVPNFSSSKHPGEGGDVVDDRSSWSFFRLLTKTLGVGIDSGWIRRNWGVSQRAGFDTTKPYDQGRGL